jgi:hypothetical protein
LKIDIDLTDEGFRTIYWKNKHNHRKWFVSFLHVFPTEHRYDVVDIVFQYLEILKRTKPQEWIFNEVSLWRLFNQSIYNRKNCLFRSLVCWCVSSPSWKQWATLNFGLCQRNLLTNIACNWHRTCKWVIVNLMFLDFVCVSATLFLHTFLQFCYHFFWQIV